VGEEMLAGPLRLVYADFTGPPVISAHEVATGEVSEVAVLPASGTVTPATGSHLVTLSSWRREQSSQVPELLVFDPGSGVQTPVPRPGINPYWNPRGDLLVFEEPLDLRNCTSEDCDVDTRVVMFDPVSGEEKVLLDGGPWTTVGWAGDRVLVADDEDASITLSVSEEDDTITYDLRAREVWGASPDGRWLVRSGPEDTDIHELGADHRLAGEPTPVQLDDGATFGVGGWSFDSSRLITALTQGEDSRLVMVSPEDGAPSPLQDIPERIGRFMWAPDHSGFVISRVTDRFETLYCPVDASIECSPLFDWTTGLLPMRIEGTAD
jgi:hypothetical protein